uniref:Uncharacterized protein n=1 Tax=Parascaris equorum TaxID=6256 RepID=A0A914RFY1_PAREQ
MVDVVVIAFLHIHITHPLPHRTSPCTASRRYVYNIRPCWTISHIPPRNICCMLRRTKHFSARIVQLTSDEKLKSGRQPSITEVPYNIHRFPRYVDKNLNVQWRDSISRQKIPLKSTLLP